VSVDIDSMQDHRLRWEIILNDNVLLLALKLQTTEYIRK